MWEKYKEIFGSVHASQRLKSEVLNMKREENVRSKRRALAVALVTAVLAVALAGTAVAYLSRVTVAPYGEGYSVQSEAGNVPLSSLSEDVLQRAATAKSRAEIIPFDSWDEAEAYLGLEIADNAKLDQMEKGLWGRGLDESEEPVVAPCIIDLRYSNSLPDTITLIASYLEGGFSVKTEAVLMIEDPAFGEDRTYSFANPMAEMNGTETHVTPSGLEAVIVVSRVAYRANFVRTEYTAQFVLNQASYSVKVSADEGGSGEEALSLLKEILDAYE